MDIIETARTAGRKILDEYESKILLSSFGIQVPREITASSAEECRAAIKKIGFPLAMKGCTPEITHKSELGLVILDIRDEQEAMNAFEKIITAMPVKKPAVVIQEMVKGKRELVVGLTRDPQFGPAVMFGLGGIFTEILSDVAFRLAPLDREDALEMIGEIKGKKILDAVRGMEAVDRDKLANVLVRVGDIAVQYPEIREIDINPLVISGRTPVAVDALIVLS